MIVASEGLQQFCCRPSEFYRFTKTGEADKIMMSIPWRNKRQEEL